jgi:putative glycerol-1-phosphate prenyltransferase
MPAFWFGRDLLFRQRYNKGSISAWLVEAFMVTTDYGKWKHVFKLDPDKLISDEHLERICTSGTDAILVGGSSGITYDNIVDLMARIRRYEVPCALEVSHPDAIAPGFDLYLIPIVLNAEDAKWITGYHMEALQEWGAVMPWEQIVPEGYIIMNNDCSAARLTAARTNLSPREVEAYARMADKLFRLPIFYVEYSGSFGDLELVRRAKAALSEGEGRLFYGGGITDSLRAEQAASVADTIVVGNIVYENIDQAIETVATVRKVKS